jgi:hippurate hydrolase
MLDTLLAEARAHQDDAITLRRAIHRDPEIGNHLPHTREKVLAALDGLPLRIALHDTTSGIVAVLQGTHPGPSIVLRGDMDALPLSEDTGLPYASESEGAMHACGHDLHTTMLVMAVRVLSRHRDRLHGSVIFMFQPGEEGHHGARFMLDEGLLDAAGDRPTGAFAIHVSPLYDTGTINHRPGPQMAAQDKVEVTVTGRGGHASAPYLALDPIPVAAETILAIETALTRRIDPFDPAVVTFGRLAAGTTHNIIPETASLQGTIRSLSEATRALVHRLVRDVATGVASAHGATATVDIGPGYPVTVNDAAFTAFVTGIAEQTLGSGAVAALPSPIMGAEDWSYVLQQVPGTMSFLGACPSGHRPGTAPGNHSNVVVFDEEAMPSGIAMYAGVAIGHLSG